MNRRNKEERTIAAMTKLMVVNCARNSVLEDYHAGKWPASNNKNGSDIRIIDADGMEYRWNEISRISDLEMKVFMKQVVDRIYTFLTFFEDEEFQRLMCRHEASTRKWDSPKIDEKMLGQALAVRLLKDR